MQSKAPTLNLIAQVAGVSKRAVILALKGKPGVSEATRKRIKAIAKEHDYGKKATTLDEIARLSGISKSSVSVALNGRDGVSDLTRSKVKAIAGKLGYEINPLISSMMNQVQMGRSKTSRPILGFVILRPRGVWPFLSEVQKGIQIRAPQFGYRIEEFCIGEDGIKFENLEYELRKRGVEGVIISDMWGSKRNLPLYFQDFLGVKMGSAVEKPAVSRVCPHYAMNLRTAIQGVRTLGYRRIGMFVSRTCEERSEHTYCAVFTESPETSAPGELKIPVCYSDKDEDNLRLVFKDWFLQYHPDAIITLYDSVKTWLSELKIRIPEEVGLANLSLKPGQNWTGINQNFTLMAEAAVELLDTQFRLKQRTLPTYPHTLLVRGFWVAGETATRR